MKASEYVTWDLKFTTIVNKFNLITMSLKEKQIFFVIYAWQQIERIIPHSQLWTSDSLGKCFCSFVNQFQNIFEFPIVNLWGMWKGSASECRLFVILFNNQTNVLILTMQNLSDLAISLLCVSIRWVITSLWRPFGVRSLLPWLQLSPCAPSTPLETAAWCCSMLSFTPHGTWWSWSLLYCWGYLGASGGRCSSRPILPGVGYVSRKPMENVCFVPPTAWLLITHLPLLKVKAPVWVTTPSLKCWRWQLWPLWLLTRTATPGWAEPS